MGVAKALADSSSSTSPPAANMPLPVISFHLGAEHGFLKKEEQLGEPQLVNRGSKHLGEAQLVNHSSIYTS
jgi:hypothetical protein